MKEPLEWKKFSDEWPTCRWIWYYTTQVIELDRPSDLSKTSILKNYIDWTWAEAKIDYPEVPKKERHQCERKSQLGLWNFRCYEHPTRGLMIEANNDPEIEVIICPFCGYKPEGK